MKAKSNISSSLNKRRRKSFLIRLLLLFIVFLVLFTLFAFFTNNERIKIKEINVSGNTSIPTSSITDIVKARLSEKFLYFVSRDNLFIFPRFDIENTLLDSLKKIEKVRIGFGGFSKMNVYITERVQKALWCMGVPNLVGQCYFLDSSGLIFAEAPVFSGNPFVEYYGLVKDDNPIGQGYLDSQKFQDIFSFLDEIKKIGFVAEGFNAIDEHEYEIYIVGGGKINLNDTDSFAELAKRLKALVDNGLIKTDTISLSKINHIDLRYGNKVHYDFR